MEKKNRPELKAEHLKGVCGLLNAGDLCHINAQERNQIVSAAPNYTNVMLQCLLDATASKKNPRLSMFTCPIVFRIHEFAF